MSLIQPLFGLACLVALAWAVSENRRTVPWLWVGGAVAVQFVLAVLLLRVPLLQEGLAYAGAAVRALERASRAGSSYMFGYLGGGELPFDPPGDVSTLIIAFEILPIILVTAALSALFWHWGILPRVIRGMGFLLERGLRVGGAVAFGTAANFFLGVVESPLVVRAYLGRMSRSELFMIMVAGMATVSGAVLVLYAAVIEPVVPDATAHILTASLISLPASLLFARIMVPGESVTKAEEFDRQISYHNTLDALVYGVSDGLKVMLSVMAMLIVVFALVHLFNDVLGLAPDIAGQPLTLDRIFGWIFAPLVFLFGVPWHDAAEAGQLMGAKAILNEFIGYQRLSALEPGTIEPRTAIIMTYAMCGFANLASIGLQLATLATLAPERRADIASLGWRAWIAGNLATGSTAAIAAMLI